MKLPSAEEVKIAAESVHIHERTTFRVDGLAELVRTDPTIRALIDALGREWRRPVIDLAFLTGLELGLRVADAREHAARGRP